MTTPRRPETRGQEAHYEKLLAPIYGWMVGDFEQALARSRAELQSLGVGPARPPARALDLGAGTGLQSIPLSQLGYAVTAVDTSRVLLDELTARCRDVRAVHADFRSCEDALEGPFDLVVCMGDTLTHLPALDDVSRTFEMAHRVLSTEGMLVVTFRDYASRAREGTDRFLLVRADAERMLTVCLDYGEDTVRVTDLVHERRGERWELTASEYEKLRLSADRVRSELGRAGFGVERCAATEGVVRVVARK